MISIAGQDDHEFNQHQSYRTKKKGFIIINENFIFQVMKIMELIYQLYVWMNFFKLYIKFIVLIEDIRDKINQPTKYLQDFLVYLDKLLDYL